MIDESSDLVLSVVSQATGDAPYNAAVHIAITNVNDNGETTILEFDEEIALTEDSPLLENAQGSINSDDFSTIPDPTTTLFTDPQGITADDGDAPTSMASSIMTETNGEIYFTSGFNEVSSISESLETGSQLSMTDDEQEAESTASDDSSTTLSPINEGYIAGYYLDGQPHWSVLIPAALGPWSSIEIQGENPGTNYYLTSVFWSLNGVYVPGDISFARNDFSAQFQGSIDEQSGLTLTISGQAIGPAPYSIDVHITILPPEDNVSRLMKRNNLEFDLSSSLNEDAEYWSDSDTSLVSYYNDDPDLISSVLQTDPFTATTLFSEDVTVSNTFETSLVNYTDYLPNSSDPGYIPSLSSYIGAAVSDRLAIPSFFLLIISSILL